MHLDPEDVFTPKTIVSKRMFERRNEPDLSGRPGLQDLLRDAIRERGCQVLLYGDTGVGKSSLLTNVADLVGAETLEIDCKSGMSMDDIIDHGNRQLVRFRAIGRSRSSTIEADAETSAEVPFFARIRARIMSRFEQKDEFEVVESPAFTSLLQAMNSKGRTLLVLDNFQNIDLPNTRVQVAQHMESLSDAIGKKRVSGNLKFVVIGIADDANTLLGDSMSYVRRAEQIGVPRMPDQEIQEILNRGFGLLGLSASAVQLAKLVFYSDGFPYFAHLVGLHVSRAVIQDNVREVSDSSIDTAIARAAASVSASYAERLRLAYERGGSTQPRKQIVRFLAASSGRQWEYREVIELWKLANPTEVRTSYNFLSAALGQLADSAQGQILTSTGARGRFVYRFTDPHIRPFVRIQENLAPE
jgi:Cdc6-like AAA superfamily ATPase